MKPVYRLSLPSRLPNGYSGTDQLHPDPKALNINHSWIDGNRMNMAAETSSLNLHSTHLRFNCQGAGQQYEKVR